MLSSYSVVKCVLPKRVFYVNIVVFWLMWYAIPVKYEGFKEDSSLNLMQTALVFKGRSVCCPVFPVVLCGDHSYTLISLSLNIQGHMRK